MRKIWNHCFELQQTMILHRAKTDILQLFCRTRAGLFSLDEVLYYEIVFICKFDIIDADISIKDIDSGLNGLQLRSGLMRRFEIHRDPDHMPS